MCDTLQQRAFDDIKGHGRNPKYWVGGHCLRSRETQRIVQSINLEI
jgi:hypothetical protein